MSNLFVLKRREEYHLTSQGLSTGLYNSAKFVCDLLISLGHAASLVVVEHSNEIDRVVSRVRPTRVFIEALWVSPEKLTELQRLHPQVQWIVRIHSQLPFLANEGMAMSWLGEYRRIPKVWVAGNSPRFCRDVQGYVGSEQLQFLPNYYPAHHFRTKLHDFTDRVLDVACFGAIRPLKNHLLQASVAIDFADHRHKHLHFHVNADRIEMKGDSVLKNLVGLFDHQEGRHQLIRHPWMPHSEFLALCGQMDLGMQCSLSETFNIVGADLISQGVPLIASHEIPWVPVEYGVTPTHGTEMFQQLDRAYESPHLNLEAHRIELQNYGRMSREIWAEFLTS